MSRVGEIYTFPNSSVAYRKMKFSFKHFLKSFFEVVRGFSFQGNACRLIYPLLDRNTRRFNVAFSNSFKNNVDVEASKWLTMVKY